MRWELAIVQAFGATFPQPDAERAASLLGSELLEALAEARRDGDAAGLEAVAALLRIYEVRLRRLSPLISSILPLSPPFSHYLLIPPSIPSYLPLSPPISSHLLRIHQARLGGLLPKLRAALQASPLVEELLLERPPDRPAGQMSCGSRSHVLRASRPAGGRPSSPWGSSGPDDDDDEDEEPCRR